MEKKEDEAREKEEAAAKEEIQITQFSRSLLERNEFSLRKVAYKF